jgi:metal-sulfur cluster biosynthetic enzyme
MSTEFDHEPPEEPPCPYPDYEPTARSVADLPNTGADADGVEARVWDALYGVEDPEMPVSVVDLGLIYGVEVREAPEEPREGGDSEARSASGRASGLRGGETASNETAKPSRGPREEAAGKTAYVEMTLTYTGCPARDMLTGEVEDAAASADGVADAEVVLVWSPGWSVDLVTEQGRQDLREFGLSVPEPGDDTA